MTIRTRILLLLSGVLLFSLGASALSLRELGRSRAELDRAADTGVGLLRVASEVTAGHLEQSIRFERALRHAARDTPEAEQAYRRAREEFERLSADIWRSLQRGREIADAAAAEGGPYARRVDAFARLLAQIDHAHNEYALQVREVLGLLGRGDLDAARARAEQIQQGRDQVDQALGRMLAEVAQRGETVSRTAQAGEDRAFVVVGLLLLMTFLLTAVAFAYCVRLVSEMRSLGGLLPICASCKMIRDDRGYWNQLEAYLEEHSEAEFTHGLCSECVARLREEAGVGRDASSPASAASR